MEMPWRCEDRASAAGEFDYFFDNLIDVQREQWFRIRATPIELPHAGDDLSDVSTRLVDGLQVMS